jgi:HK97 family phage prohead protease
MNPATSAAREFLGALTEKNDDGLVRRSFGITVKAGSLDEKRRCVRVIASTDSIDSYEEVVDQTWQLARYNKNSVVLYNHNRVGFLGLGGAPEHTLPIGYAEDVRMVDGHLEATLCFVDKNANPLAELVWQGFLQGSIRAVSVGFLPHSVYEETENDRDILHLADNELYEISAVAIPANADAVALSADGGGKERDRLRARARAANPKSPSARAEPPENTMDPKEVEKQLTAAEATITAQKTAIAGLEASVKTAQDAQKTAETALKTAETALETEKTEHEKAKASLLTATSEKSTSEGKLIEREVDDLVGKKITPAEKVEFLELRKSNPELFAKMVAKRADLVHVREVTKTETKRSRSGASSILGNARKRAAG